MIVGDRRATAGNVIVTDTVDKVIELDSSSVLAIAGVPATAFEIAIQLAQFLRRQSLLPQGDRPIEKRKERQFIPGQRQAHWRGRFNGRTLKKRL